MWMRLWQHIWNHQIKSGFVSGQSGPRVKPFWKPSLGYSERQMTSSLYRTQLFPSSGRALFSGLIWSPPRSRRADDDSAWIESANIQGQPPPQWLSRLYQYHPHHRFKPVHLRLWIRHRLPKQAADPHAGNQKWPNKEKTWPSESHHTLLRSTEMYLCRGHWAHSGQWCHMTGPTSGSTDCFRCWNPALLYRRVRSGAQWLRGRSAFLRLSAPSRSQRELPDTRCIVGEETLRSGMVGSSRLACHETAPLCTGIPLKTYRLGCRWKLRLVQDVTRLTLTQWPNLSPTSYLSSSAAFCTGWASIFSRCQTSYTTWRYAAHVGH